MAAGDYKSILAAANPSTLLTDAAIAWTFGVKAEIVPSDTYIGIVGLNFATNVIPGLDTTVQGIIEVYSGTVISNSLIAQFPFSFRDDTQAGYYQMQAVTDTLPEPLFVDLSGGLSLHLRVAHSLGSLGTYTCKVLYNEQAPPPGLFTPVDPYGMMGIFGL